MLFRKRFWAGLADGSVTMAFRRWSRPQVIAGRPYRSPAGMLHVDAVESVEPAAQLAQLRALGDLLPQHLAGIGARVVEGHPEDGDVRPPGKLVAQLGGVAVARPGGVLLADGVELDRLDRIDVQHPRR